MLYADTQTQFKRPGWRPLLVLLTHTSRTVSIPPTSSSCTWFAIAYACQCSHMRAPATVTAVYIHPLAWYRVFVYSANCPSGKKRGGIEKGSQLSQLPIKIIFHAVTCLFINIARGRAMEPRVPRPALCVLARISTGDYW